MSIEIVREYLKQFQADERIMEFETSSATVELAAEAVGCIPARIAKTLSFYCCDNRKQCIHDVCLGLLLFPLAKLKVSLNNFV